MPARLQVWFDPASTYAYLSAMRIDAMAANRHVEVEWRPFLLGPIFKAQGWDTSPFNIYPAKGRYMVRDIDRIAAARGLKPFRLPDPFPGRSIKAARLALLAADQERIAPFMRALFQKAFADGRDISDGDVLRECLRTAGVPEVDARIAAADEPSVKDRLRRETEHALSLGVFGAPTFVAPGGELFWEDDRLEQAIDWSAAVCVRRAGSDLRALSGRKS